ncbi:MAG: hypothetical protein IT584_03540 [Chlamydiae bacterium]|nr:hypothetical protein [Chlamydiota bacterium]
MAFGVFGRTESSFGYFGIPPLEIDRELATKISRIALNCLASLSIARDAFQATRVYGSYSIYISCGVAFVLVCDRLDRKAPSASGSVLSEETLDRLSRILWVSQFLLGSVLLGVMFAGLSEGGKWLLAGVKGKDALTVCRGIHFLSWEIGFVAPLTGLLLCASLPFEDQHIGLLKQFEEAAPGHLIMENLIATVRGFSPRLFFSKLSFVAVVELFGRFYNQFPPWAVSVYVPAYFFAQYQLLQSQSDVGRLGMGFFLLMRMALEGRVDLEVLDSYITSLDEEAKKRWFLAVNQSPQKVLSKEKLLEILKKFPQDFPWDFLAEHLSEDQFRSYIQPELVHFKRHLGDPRLIRSFEKETIEGEILRLDSEVTFLQTNREIQGWNKRLEETKQAAFSLRERLDFTAKLATSFPKNLLPSPSYKDVNEVIQTPLRAKELLHSFKEEAPEKLHEDQQDDLNQAVAEIDGSSSNLDNQEVKSLHPISLLKVLSRLESLSSGVSAELSQESIQQILTKEFQFDSQDFFLLGAALSIPIQELINDRFGTVTAYLHDLGLSSRRDLEVHGFLNIIGNEQESRKSQIIHKFAEICKQLEEEKSEEDSYQVLIDAFKFDTEDFRDLEEKLKVVKEKSDESPAQATARWLCDRGLSNRKELKGKGILDRLANGRVPGKELVKQRIIAVCQAFDKAKGREQPRVVIFEEPQRIEIAELEEGHLEERLVSARIHQIFARVLQGTLIFLQIAECPRSTTVGFLVGLGLPQARFSFFEGRYWSLINMSELYLLDPTSLSLDGGVFALSRTIHSCFQAALYSVDFDAMGGFLAGITHARMVRRISYSN